MKELKRHPVLVVCILLSSIGITLLAAIIVIKKLNMVSLITTFRRTKYVCDRCNVILVSLDTLRADELPCYGYDRNTAPKLCAFAQQNIRFTNAYSQSSYTLSSHFSIFTSLYPSSHRMLVALRDTLSPTIQTLPQILKSFGYETMYVGPTNDFTLPLDRGLERGFDFIQHSGSNTAGWSSGFQKLREQRNAKKPLFLFLHSYMVHAPYLPGKSEHRMFTTDSDPTIPVTWDEYEAFTPALWQLVINDLNRRRQSQQSTVKAAQRLDAMYRKLTNATTFLKAQEVFTSFPEEERESYATMLYMQESRYDDRQVAYLRALYDEKIYQLDQILGTLFELVENLGLADQTIIVITSDHGEEFREHGALFHTTNIYNTSTHVPLIIHAPNIKNKTQTEIAQSIDIVPTILGMLSIPKPEGLEGIDLTGIIRDDPFAPVNTYSFSELGFGSIRSVMDKQWKLYVRKGNQGTPPSYELYDVISDPLEQHDVASLHPDVVQRLVQAQPKTRQVKNQNRNGVFPEWIDAEKRKKLMKEGYF